MVLLYFKWRTGVFVIVWNLNVPQRPKCQWLGLWCYWEVVEPLVGGASGRKWGHWGCALEDIEILALLPAWFAHTLTYIKKIMLAFHGCDKINLKGEKIYFNTFSEVSAHDHLALLVLGLWQGRKSWQGASGGAKLLTHGSQEVKRT